jgi:hypothetical protein
MAKRNLFASLTSLTVEYLYLRNRTKVATLSIEVRGVSRNQTLPSPDFEGIPKKILSTQKPRAGACEAAADDFFCYPFGSGEVSCRTLPNILLLRAFHVIRHRLSIFAHIIHDQKEKKSWQQELMFSVRHASIFGRLLGE